MSAAKLKQLVSYIEDNLESDLPLADIARVAGLSVSHMNTLFRRSTGIAIHQYVLRRRVERAKDLDQLGKAVEAALAQDGPVFVLSEVAAGEPEDLAPRVVHEPPEIANRFRRASLDAKVAGAKA